MSVVAADLAPSLIGAAVAVVVAGGGWVVSSRGQRTDSASALVTAALAIAERHGQDETECRQRLDELAAEHANCFRRLSGIESALATAGIPIPAV